eukprot:Lithocolla_globosa_v1_NODE_2273_length_2079_cov_218.775198.p1 type:complete len:120 gc:universal NODE_2273_length_2079_cov_218.775198:973-1332(+)
MIGTCHQPIIFRTIAHFVDFLRANCAQIGPPNKVAKNQKHRRRLAVSMTKNWIFSFPVTRLSVSGCDPLRCCPIGKLPIFFGRGMIGFIPPITKLTSICVRPLIGSHPLTALCCRKIGI